MTEVWSCPPAPPPLLDASLCFETSHFARGTKSGGGGLFLEIDDGKEGAILKTSDNSSLKK
tara:strand:+ start:327 stop:509 length:183 start_codon:yes stop_codon:yes gene_type:complete